jgi:hypothetical protein
VQTARATAAFGPLLLADIGGYTALLQGVTTAHPEAFAGGEVPPAFDLLSSVIDGIVDGLVPPFTLAKLEGDAVFAYATTVDVMPKGADVLRYVAACYRHFHDRLAEARSRWVCPCDACVRVHALDLKFVLHAGAFAVQRIAGQVEVAGTDVVVAHRLLKNEAASAVGSGGYLLLTQAAVDALDVPTDAGKPLVHRYEHLDPIATYVFPLPSASAARGEAGG